MGSPQLLPSQAGVVVVGAGFAGASTAAALARAGLAGGVVLERESQPGTHASGRNAAIARQLEIDPALFSLSLEGVRRLAAYTAEGRPVLHHTGGLYLLHGDARRAEGRLPHRPQGLSAELLPAAAARRRFPFLSGFLFDYAIFCPADGVIDIHALLTGLLGEASSGGFPLLTSCPVDSLILDRGAVRGVRTRLGELPAHVVVDASGAWAGNLAGPSGLPLQPLRRHLFVGGASGLIPRDAPLVWDLDVGYYLRPEPAGLLLCPCDETPHPPASPAVDPDAADLLAAKLLEHAPGLAGLDLRRCWACLRTFAPDRLPVIGWDPLIEGLFHVSGLGGFGVSTSLAVGELAAALIAGRPLDWIDPDSFSPRRQALAAALR